MSERRILFVDDEPAVLEGIRAMLAAQTDWQLAFVTDAAAALTALGQASFDMVVTDMRMPGTDGVALLEAVRDQYPQVARVALSGRTDRESVARALTVAQQFLGKPCNGSVLRMQITRVCDLRARLTDKAVKSVIGRMDKLPSTPTVYFELTKAVAKPEVGLADIANIVDCDAAISAKVLQLVNSAYFGLAQPISSIHQAVLYLGVDLLKALALTAHVFTREQSARLDGFSMNVLQEQSMLCAQLASRLVDDQGLGDEAYAAGLIHDIGKVVLAVGMPKEFAEVLRTTRFRKMAAHLVEKELLGVTHAEVGAYLLGAWGLPFSAVEAVAYQHNPAAVTMGPRPVLAAIHLADALVKAAYAREDEASLLRRLDMTFLTEAGLAADLPTWFALAKEQLPTPAKKRSLS
jgi:HD-like signal output (HDOD) protein